LATELKVIGAATKMSIWMRLLPPGSRSDRTGSRSADPIDFAEAGEPARGGVVTATVAVDQGLDQPDPMV
jgi:hypothetical protein